MAKDQIDLPPGAAANAMDRQRWAFVVIRDRALLKRIFDEAKVLTLKMMGSAPAVRSFGNCRFSGFIFYERAAFVIVPHRGRSVRRSGLLSRGGEPHAGSMPRFLGTCWIGFAEAWLGQAESKELSIPAHYRPIAPIILGHPR